MNSYPRRYLFSLTLCVAITGCSATSITPSLEASSNIIRSSATAKQQYLYVVNAGGNSVTVYAAGGTSVLRTIKNGIADPLHLEFDPRGNLYVANNAGDVSVYAPGASAPKYTIKSGICEPFALAFHSKDLYVANDCLASGSGSGAVTRYAAGSTKPNLTITNGVSGPMALALDASGNVYVGNTYAPLTAYKPGSKSAWYTIGSVQNCEAMAFDRFGTLYVANAFGDVDEFAPSASGRMKLQRDLGYAAGINVPNALAVDASGTLYVANNGGGPADNGSVTVYARGATKPNLTISNRIHQPKAIALDSSGNVYVANSNNTVTEYSTSGKLLHTVVNGLGSPAALAIGSHS